LQIEDLWHSMYVSSYWRNSGVLNNAISGVDMACWDILGKRAGMPVWQLLGGKARRAVDTYRHASGADPQAVENAVRAYMDKGYRYVRAQMGIPGQATYGMGGAVGPKVAGETNNTSRVWEPRAYTRQIPKLFDHLRKKLGDEVELLHDSHERLPPI